MKTLCILAVLLFYQTAYGQAPKLFAIDDSIPGAGTVAGVVEVSQVQLEVEDESEINTSQKYDYLSTSAGLAYSITDKILARGGIAFVREHDTSSSDFIVSDPVFELWYRHKSEDNGEFYGDWGLSFSPKITNEKLLKENSGNHVEAKYRFGISEGRFGAHARYSIGYHDGRKIKDTPNRGRLGSSTYLGLNVVLSAKLLSRLRTAVDFDLRRSSAHSGTVFYANMVEESSWRTQYDIFLIYSMFENYDLALFFGHSNESAEFNQFSSSKGPDLEKASYGVSIYARDF